MTDSHNKPPTNPPTQAVSAIGYSQTVITDSRPPVATGLRVVTVAPGHPSYPDGMMPSYQDAAAVSQMPGYRQDPYLGSTIDARYKVEALLGEGGMGVVYRCVHTIIGKKVAMKVLRADLARDAEVTERFLNEAKAASAIGNAHIIDISDFGQFPDGSTYFVMEFLSGQPLSKVLEGGVPVPIPRLVHITRQLCEGLAAAHAANIVHRDLKPDNIFLISRGADKDFVKILDFGIAKVSTSSEGSKLTRAGAVFGTPHYMSPEQAAGQPVDLRGDIYSLGVILYEMASGRVPFDADNFMGILTQHMYKAPVPIRALVPQAQEVPPGLEAIVLKCLSKRPEHRYQTMEELLVDLDRFKTGTMPEAVPELMSRSGGYNVPADYFKKAGMPAPMPATPSSPPKRSSVPLIAGIAGALATIAIAVAIFAKIKASGAATATTSQTAAQPVAAPPPAPPPPASAPTETKPKSRQVTLAVEPIEAHVFQGEKDLGTSPVVVDVEPEQALEVEIRLAGYKSTRMTLDGKTLRQSVKLERERVPGVRPPAPPPAPAVRPPQPPATTRPPSSGKIGGGEIVNPWSR